MAKHAEASPTHEAPMKNASFIPVIQTGSSTVRPGTRSCQFATRSSGTLVAQRPAFAGPGLGGRANDIQKLVRPLEAVCSLTNI